MENIKLLVIRDFKLAIIHATVWILLFWISGHPIDEWAVTAVVLYIPLWLSIEIVLRLVSFTARRLSNYVSRAAQKAGIEFPERRPHGLSNKRRPIAVFLILFSTIIGLSLSVGIPAVGLVGLTPLPSYFYWAAWGFLCIGGVSLLLIFGITATLPTVVNALHGGLGSRITRSHAMTRDVASAAGFFQKSISV